MALMHHAMESVYLSPTSVTEHMRLALRLMEPVTKFLASLISSQPAVYPQRLVKILSSLKPSRHNGHGVNGERAQRQGYL